MGKPDDVTQEAWDEAYARWHRGRGIADNARAIMETERRVKSQCVSALMNLVQQHGEPGAVAANPYIDLHAAIAAVCARWKP